MTKHLIMVPGFVGFDALGQLPYYAGVTECFEKWAKANKGEFAIDYFDNFPTASVEYRAKRLRKFLAKKMARGQIGPNDEITLLGHSTGGLDIRRLLRDLRKQTATFVDQKNQEVSPVNLRAQIKRIVFMSVPHFGTNIADFACRLREPIQGLTQGVSLSLAVNRAVPIFGELVTQLLDGNKCELFLAIADALRETDERAQREDQADEREARFDLALWLQHIARDISALGDLRSYTLKTAGEPSPAHAEQAERANELSDLRSGANPIQTLSFATRVTGAKRGDLLTHVEKALLKALSVSAPLVNGLAGLERTFDRAGVAWGAGGLTAAAYPLLRFNARPASLFETLHGICADATLPFRDPTDAYVDAIADQVVARGSGAVLTRADIGRAANDGIVNTLSMLWPFDRSAAGQHRLELVEADHADIIGHHSRHDLQQPRPHGRERDAYDLFESGSGFKQAQFESIWKDVFKFAF
jgi:triacylglycerol lipase